MQQGKAPGAPAIIRPRKPPPQHAREQVRQHAAAGHASGIRRVFGGGGAFVGEAHARVPQLG